MYIDVMVSPVNLRQFNEAGIRNGWKLYVMIPNVQKLIDKSANFKDYSETGSTNPLLDEGIQIILCQVNETNNCVQIILCQIRLICLIIHFTLFYIPFN